MAADAGRLVRSFPVAFGPARLHFALGNMELIPRILVLTCCVGALYQWFWVLIIFTNLAAMWEKVGFGYRTSVGASGLFVFVVGSAGLISLCFVSRRGLPVGSLWRPVAAMVMCALAAGAALAALGVCSPWFEIAGR